MEHEVTFAARQPLRPREDRPRMGAGARLAVDGMVLGEWSLRAAAWTDRHGHVEVNHVLEGELHVTVDGTTTVAGPGDTVAVPAGALARYAAPEYARMFFVYSQAPGGHRSDDNRYEEL